MTDKTNNEYLSQLILAMQEHITPLVNAWTKVDCRSGTVNLSVVYASTFCPRWNQPATGSPGNPVGLDSPVENETLSPPSFLSLRLAGKFVCRRNFHEEEQT